MLEGWQRADVISGLAMVISALALVASAFAARFTYVQTKLAKRKAREEDAAREPAIEPSIKALHWPGFYLVDLHIRNRLDIAISCDELRIHQPRGATCARYRDVAIKNSNFDLVLPETRPATASWRHTIDVSHELKSAGSLTDLQHYTWRHDRTHLEVLVFSPSSSSKARAYLRMSLSVRLINESEPFAESIVVVKIPTVTTKRET